MPPGELLRVTIKSDRHFPGGGEVAIAFYHFKDVSYLSRLSIDKLNHWTTRSGAGLIQTTGRDFIIDDEIPTT